MTSVTSNTSTYFPKELSFFNRFLKRTMDIVASFGGLVAFSWLLIILVMIARIDTGASGLFTQKRVGRNRQPFTLFKIRTMKDDKAISTTSTTSNDTRITNFGRFLRNWKLDELPQLWNVLKGDMSLVGPRPDVDSAYVASGLDFSSIFKVRPGITGPASIYFKNEEEILAEQDDPEWFSSHVIMPKKCELNLEYIDNYSILNDLLIVWRTIFPGNLK